MSRCHRSFCRIPISRRCSPPPPASPAGRTGRILKYDRDGNFIKQWGEIGFRPGQFRTPHAMEFDAQGRLFVADRGNHRIQIFDREGELLDTYHQFSRISGLFITADGNVFVAEGPASRATAGGGVTKYSRTMN